MKKFTLLLAAMLLSVMSFAEWQRVTTVTELLQGGTMIIGYEATANSGVIVPMRTEGTATTSDAGYMYSGTTAGTSTKNTVDMSKLSESTAYEVRVVPSTSVTGAVCIKIGDKFLGNTNTKNNCKLFTTESATTAFTPTVGDNDVFTLKIAANTGNTTNYTTLQYNTNSPRFAVYGGTQKNVVIYKKVETANLLSIVITGEPTKKDYMAGDAFSTDGLKVMGNYENNDTPVEITSGITWTVTPATLTAGTTSVEVKATVGGKTTTRTITSLTVTAAKTLTSIAVSGTPAEFWKGDTFNHDGMTVTATWDDNSTTDVTAEATFSTPDMTTAGVKTITVTYKEETTTYNITVKTIANTQEKAYTVAEAIALIKAGKDLTTEVFVKGIVSKIVTALSDDYNTTYNISDDGATASEQFQLYRCVTNGANVGDVVIAKGVMTKYYSTFEFAAGNEIVAIMENTNPVLTCAESVAFGNISSLVGTAPSKTLEVTAKNLTEDITVTLSANEAFTLSTITLPAEGGSIEITPVLTIGEHTATLTLTSGDKSVTVTLTATIQQAYTISWSVNGNVTSTTAVIEGENLVLPASPEAPNDCASKVFVGWATTATVAADGTGIVFVDAATPATADATYYAVFATATESTPTTASVTFSDMFSDVVTSKNIDGVALDITDGITVTFAKSSSSSNTAMYYSNGAAVRLYAGGSITINSTTTITSFTLTFGTTDDGKNTFAADCGTWDSPTWTGEAKTIVLTESDTSGQRRIAGISVSYKQTAWEEYATTCDDTPSAIDNAAVETPAIKTIENGQLIILRDGVKYNAMGVRLQ